MRPSIGVKHKSMSDHRVIGLIGPVRAGKTTACEYLRDHHNAIAFRNSEVLEKILHHLRLDRNRENLAHIGLALFDTFGRDLLAKHWLGQLEGTPPNETQVVVVDGLRFPEELSFYRQHTSFTLVAVVAPNEQRYTRSKTAADRFKDGTLDKESFLIQSTANNEFFVEQLIKESDIVISNDKTLNDLYCKLDEFISIQIHK